MSVVCVLLHFIFASVQHYMENAASKYIFSQTYFYYLRLFLQVYILATQFANISLRCFLNDANQCCNCACFPLIHMQFTGALWSIISREMLSKVYCYDTTYYSLYQLYIRKMCGTFEQCSINIYSANKWMDILCIIVNTICVNWFVVPFDCLHCWSTDGVLGTMASVRVCRPL